MNEGWNLYMLYNLKREQRASIIRQDARHESAFVRECTDIALSTDKLDIPKEFDKIDLEYQF